MLGEDPTAEINQVRERAYGKRILRKPTKLHWRAYPNDKGDFYTDNKYMSGDEDPLEAILKERYA
ncbi:RagB/SusD family nutrient uptake outer membrane protein [Bacteroides fragilis]|nr:RagB/SusD family nutrient uptake outer membrane protein [Bacteroides fragilis]